MRGLTFLVLIFSTQIIKQLRVGATDLVCDYSGPRFDCGYVGISQEECENKKCCWIPATRFDFVHIDVPWCFTRNAQEAHYSVLQHTPHSLSLSLEKSSQPELGNDVEKLTLIAQEITPDIFRIQIDDARYPRYRVPSDIFHPKSILHTLSYGMTRDTAKQHANTSSSFSFEYNSNPFSFRLFSHQKQDHTKTLLWNSTGTRLMFKEQYIEMTTLIDPGITLYGAGERSSGTLHLIRNGFPRTLYNHDLGPTFVEHNSYGSHPFILALDNQGISYGIFLFSSNAMDIVPSESKLSFRLTGGMIDLFLLRGPSPLDVIDQLTQVVGRPAMVPYWSLGWQQCKFGYKNVWEVEEVVENYTHAGIPLEVSFVFDMFCYEILYAWIF